MRQDEDAGESLNSLQRERPLAIQVYPSTVTPREQVRMPCFGLREPAFGAGKLLINVSRRAADLLVRSLEQFGERQLNMRTDPIDFRESIFARLFEERRQRVLVEPARLLWMDSDRRQV